MLPPRKTRRPPDVDVDVARGRSRDVSRAAIARRASEERRATRRAATRPQAIFNAHASTSQSYHSRSPLALPSSSSSSSSRLAQPSSPVAGPSSLPRMADTASSPRHVATTSAAPRQPTLDGCKSLTLARPSTRAPLFTTHDEDDEEPLPPRSLQDQMQEAYAADDMHLARVLFLKIRGIDVAGDDDPRIAQVKDEDFEFVPGGMLMLDEESLAALQADKERREREEVVRQRRLREREWALSVEAERREAAKAYTRRHWEKTQSIPHTQKLELMHNARFMSDNSLPRQFKQAPLPFPPPRSLLQASSLPPASERPSVSYRRKHTFISSAEISRCRRGRLFIDIETSELGEEIQKHRSSSQERLLGILLQEPDCPADRRRILKGKARHSLVSWDAVHVSSLHNGDALCVSSSVKTSSTISRTNSWASSSSSATSSTCITSPPNSPCLRKASLPTNSRKPDVVAKRPSRSIWTRKGLSSVVVTETPLFNPDAVRLRKSVKPNTDESTNSNGKLLTRVKQSVSSLLDLASKMQQSYLRTVQFSVTLPLESTACEDLATSELAPKPVGYRATSADVQVFAPQLRGPPIRELNFPSEFNIPLTSPASSKRSPTAPINNRVFAPLVFTPPSPQRHRDSDVLLTPEWRIRPVANPCTLRLRALANNLSDRGIMWEGRAHEGSLGCGRERLMGVAFEGLGGSRLAFEAY